ncbi:hypothetical protein EVAR_100032_1 [Eumeta japonica]|uniref:Uncharacterized protein n=1 Tax=Eumeta variegata TaxID=151549 RepID=A0A4C1ZUI4_EUMVA|nr:hypothetical protein EVAR_100032_1 [Eumeta japonica]
MQAIYDYFIKIGSGMQLKDNKHTHRLIDVRRAFSRDKRPCELLESTRSSTLPIAIPKEASVRCQPLGRNRKSNGAENGPMKRKWRNERGSSQRNSQNS